MLAMMALNGSGRARCASRAGMNEQVLIQRIGHSLVSQTLDDVPSRTAYTDVDRENDGIMLRR